MYKVILQEIRQFWQTLQGVYGIQQHPHPQYHMGLLGGSTCYIYLSSQELHLSVTGYLNISRLIIYYLKCVQVVYLQRQWQDL